MLLVAFVVFTYYTTWALLLVCILCHAGWWALLRRLDRLYLLYVQAHGLPLRGMIYCGDVARKIPPLRASFLHSHSPRLSLTAAIPPPHFRPARPLPAARVGRPGPGVPPPPRSRWRGRILRKSLSRRSSQEAQAIGQGGISLLPPQLYRVDMHLVIICSINEYKDYTTARSQPGMLAKPTPTQIKHASVHVSAHGASA